MTVGGRLGACNVRRHCGRLARHLLLTNVQGTFISASRSAACSALHALAPQAGEVRWDAPSSRRPEWFSRAEVSPAKMSRTGLIGQRLLGLQAYNACG